MCNNSSYGRGQRLGSPPEICGMIKDESKDVDLPKRVWVDNLT